jgi:VCPO second helical-bundle domain
MGGQLIEAWAGPFQGTQSIAAEAFRSYIPTPPFAEYTSGHSAFSAASARVLQIITGSPLLNATTTFTPGSSTIEPGWTPAAEVTLTWRTFGDAADEAGLSRRFGGIHFRQADLESRRMGRQIGERVWHKAQKYFRGIAQ